MAHSRDNYKATEPLRKVIGVPLRKEIQKEQDGSIIVRGYFTSDNKDEVGDMITRSATERAVPKYRQWGNIRYMHLPRPVAKVLRIGSDDGLEWNEVEIRVIDPQAVFEVEQGLLAALSVGILIKFEDIDWLEDGGLIINDYTLAEISLVDHPANYDARLKDLPVDQGLRMLARQYGMDALAHSMQNLLDRELAMTDEVSTENDAIETEPVAETQEVPVEEPAAVVAVENSASAEEAPAEDCPEGSEPCAEQEEASEAEPVEAAAEPAPAETEEAPAEPEQGGDVKSLMVLINNVLAELQALKQEFADYRKSHEAQAEVPEATGQSEGSGEVDKEAALDAGAVEAENEQAANRKGAVIETELPGEEAAPETTAAPVKDLRQALRTYFLSRK